jgi:hypothetical protein
VKLFSCAVCREVVFFENTWCTKCQTSLLFLPDRGVLSSVEPDAAEPSLFRPLLEDTGAELYRRCRNGVEYEVCNFGVPVSSQKEYCRACELNTTIPNLGKPGAREAWLKLEVGKRRLLYTLFELGLPVEPKPAPDAPGLSFSFEEDVEGEHKVFTGHSNGLITINVAEADSPFRERMRVSMGEAYRTLLGHFRHEIGHYYWDCLIKDCDYLPRFRELFGDERLDYAEAQQRHYQSGPPADWQLRFVSAYASMHPWEDFAETWAHYLHMVDTLETAQSFGLALKARPVGRAEHAPRLTASRVDFDDFDELLEAFVPLTVALNSLNRSMGLLDPYPFVLSEPAIEKLAFVHDVVESAAASSVTTRA